MHGSYKLNVDASFYTDGLRALGAVFHSHRGDAIAGRACPFENVLNVATTEVLALLPPSPFLVGLERNSGRSTPS
jgi:hypothetical protein